MKNERGRTAGRTTVLSLLIACLTGAVWAQAGFSYSQDNDAVVVRYSRTPGEIASPDPSTTVTVYGNGRVVVQYPPYGVRQGDYETTLSKAELDELVATLVNSGVVEYDGQAVAAEKQAILRSQNMGFYVGDADISKIEIGLATYSPTGAPARSDVRREITLSALQAEARQFPSIHSLVDLASAERQLINLIDSENLSPLR